MVNELARSMSSSAPIRPKHEEKVVNSMFSARIKKLILPFESFKIKTKINLRTVISLSV